MRKPFQIAIVITILIIAVAGITAGLTDYNYYIEYEIENQGTEAFFAPINIEVNAAGMIAGAYIQPDAEDIQGSYLGTTEHITAMDLSSGSATWRFPHTAIPAGSRVKKVMYFGNASGTRNQPWIASSKDSCTVVNPGSFVFSGTQSFSIFAYVTPAVDPGTEQIIIAKNNSYQLSLMPGLEYRFMLWDDGAGTASATIDAEIDTQAHLLAWYNGQNIAGPELMLCDEIAGICDTGTITALQSSGSDVVIAESDSILDEIVVRTPHWWQPGGSGTPVGGGTPPTQSYLGGPTSVTTRGAEDWDYTAFTDWSEVTSYLVDGIYDQTDLWTKGQGSIGMYNADLICEAPNVNTGTMSDDQILTGVSFSVWMYTTNSSDRYYYYINLEAPYSTFWKYWKADISFDTPGWNMYNTGTYTLAPNGVNWTVDLLKHTTFEAMFHTASTSTPLYVSEIRIYYTPE